MNAALKRNLTNLFHRNRIVFWYDDGEQFKDELSELDIPDIELVHLCPDNQIKVKYRILKEEPDRKFLVYAPYAEPEDNDNWLLGVQVANGQFRTEQSAIILDELGVDHDCLAVIRKYLKYFQAAPRVAKIKKMLSSSSRSADLENALLAVNCNTESYILEEVVQTLVSETFEDGRTSSLDAYEQFGLWPILWDRLSSQYGYAASEPSFRDFAVHVFETSFRRNILHEQTIHPEVLFLLKGWKAKLSAELLSSVSGFALDQLGYENTLRDKGIDELRNFDDYRIVDEAIIQSLAAKVETETVSSREISKVLEDRKDTVWYERYRVTYEALLHARELQELIMSFSFSTSDFRTAVNSYAEHWFKLDYNYRKFSYCIQSDINAKNLLSGVEKSLDNLYLNSYMRPLNEAWAPIAARCMDSSWKHSLSESQKSFFEDYARPVLNENRTAIVIISDALRYEVGYQLASAINGTNRYSAELLHMVSNIPSYTQVGMASLLPHKELEIGQDSIVYVEGHKSTAGKDNRQDILNSWCANAKAFTAKEVLDMNTTVLRNHVRDNKVIYVYQDIIDDRGDKDLLKACEDAVNELKDIVVRFGSSNATLMFITSDHGFLFQHQDLSETDFLSDGSVKGDKVTYKDRRFILGYGLNQTHGVEIRDASSLGFSNTDRLQVAFPNSILRMRLQGSGMHFVHGGLGLQEVVIPLLRVTKGRNEDISFVQLQMLTDLRSITTGSQTVKFFQSDAVTDKCKGFDARFGIYSDEGVLLSNEEIKSIESTSLEARDREFSVVFNLNKAADDFNNKYVNLVVSQKKDATGRYVDIITRKIRLNRGFGLDF